MAARDWYPAPSSLRDSESTVQNKSMFPIRFPELMGKQYFRQKIQRYVSDHENRKMSFKFKYLFKNGQRRRFVSILAFGSEQEMGVVM